jgi:hypothetical protein
MVIFRDLRPFGIKVWQHPEPKQEFSFDMESFTVHKETKPNPDVASSLVPMAMVSQPTAVNIFREFERVKGPDPSETYGLKSLSCSPDLL